MATSILLSAPTDAPHPSIDRGAAAAADANFAANRAALSTTQPRLRDLLSGHPPAGQPVYARDGSLTVFGPGGKWWHHCSVPMAAAAAMLRPLDVGGRVACFLAPTLAAHLRTALGKLRRDQAVIAVVTDPADLRVILACDDFSGDLSAHRLWFAWGSDWAKELKQLLDERPGLATPAQFVRLPTTPAEDVERMVAAVGAVFGEVNAGRAREVARRRDAWRRPAPAPERLCVVAPSHFRLWDDAGAALAETLASQARETDVAEVIAFDPDDPARSSAVALLAAAEDCHAVVAADLSRADLAGVVPAAMPWVTWATRPAAIPSFASAGAGDALVLADADWKPLAAAAGWPAARVIEGSWPALRAGDPPPAPALAFVADTRPVVMPESMAEFSSHAMLWNQIAAELAADPFALGDGATNYLEGRMKRAGVGAEGFDAAAFLERLILPTYEQALARLLLRERLPLRLYGAGWDSIEEFAPHAAGPVTSGDDLVRIGRQVTAVVDCSAGLAPQPLHRLGRPVVGIAANRRDFLAGARRALAGQRLPNSSPRTLSLQQILAQLQR